MSIIKLSLRQVFLREGGSNSLVKYKKEFLVFFCFLCYICWKVFNWDGMSAGVISWVVLSFTPDDTMVDVLVAQQDVLDSRWWFWLGGPQ